MCEIVTLDLVEQPVSCPHPALAHCGQCHAGMCSGHIQECDICNHFFCGDCITSHALEHERIERRINQPDCQVA